LSKRLRHHGRASQSLGGSDLYFNHGRTLVPSDFRSDLAGAERFVRRCAKHSRAVDRFNVFNPFNCFNYVNCFNYFNLFNPMLISWTAATHVKLLKLK